MFKQIHFYLTIGIISVMSGCGGNHEKLVDASGVLKVDGKPVSGVRLAFAPNDNSKSRGGMAITEEDGSFQVMHYAQNKPGIPAGSYVVTASKFVMPDGSEIPAGTSPTSVGAKEFFPIWWTRPASKTTYNLVTIPDAGSSQLNISVDTKLDPSRQRIPTGAGPRPPALPPRPAGG